MYLLIKGLTGVDKEIEIDGSATVSDLKSTIEKLELISPEQQRLVCNGKVLVNDAATLLNYKISSGSVIHMVLALRGGYGQISSRI